MEVVFALQHQRPRKSRLIDLQGEAFEQGGVLFEGEAVLRIVVEFVERVFRVVTQVFAVAGHVLTPRLLPTSHSGKCAVGLAGPLLG